MFETDRVCLVRHFETEKNVLGIHGDSALDGLTPRGEEQLCTAARRLASHQPFQGVVFTPTPQARSSALALAGKLGIPLEDPLRLEPCRLGLASGLSQQELYEKDPHSADSLDLFRNRVIDATKLAVSGAETAEEVETRLLDWWKQEGMHRCPGQIVVGSNSTLVMLSNLLDEKLPLSGQYYNYAIPNGGLRIWKRGQTGWTTSPGLSDSRWPETDTAVHKTRRGRIHLTRFLPGWSPSGKCVLILPGTREGSRSGCLGFNTELARQLGLLGFLSVTVDPLGCGDSTPIRRTAESDAWSIIAVLQMLAGQESMASASVVGDCTTAAALSYLRARSDRIRAVIALVGVPWESQGFRTASGRESEAPCTFCMEHASGYERAERRPSVKLKHDSRSMGFVLLPHVRCQEELGSSEGAPTRYIGDSPSPGVLAQSVAESIVDLEGAF